ncbi:MAG: hypothetical protein AAFR96_00955 [Planctomycetota bacterium]
MTRANTHRWILGAVFAAFAGIGGAQQVEYVTRNVQPAHAVRFNASPIRITLTDRGFRAPLREASLRSGEGRSRSKHGLPRRSIFGPIVLGGIGFHRGTSLHAVDATPAPTQPRTIYGRDLPHNRPIERPEADVRERDAETDSESTSAAAERRRSASIVLARSGDGERAASTETMRTGGADEVRAARRAYLLRVRAMIEAQNRESTTKPAVATADDR